MYTHLPLDAARTSLTAPSPEVASARRNLNQLSSRVVKSKRIVVVTGAGISVSSGIPDFRSSDGLYNLVKARYPDVVMKGRDLFSASLFREPESTRLFYTFIAELKSRIDQAKPGPTHRFIRILGDKGKLLRSYTQNIDGFEERAGLAGTVTLKGKSKKFNSKQTKNVQLHGDIHRVRCVMCSADMPCTPTYLHAFLDGNPPECPECLSRCDARVARNARALAVGSLRPAIVLYDESHPLGEEIGAICSTDISRRPDLLVIMGTSLKVHGIKRLVKDFANAVHAPPKSSTKDGSKSPSTSPVKIQPTPSENPLLNKSARLVVFVNRTPPPADLASVIDVWVEGDTDSWVSKVEADWKTNHRSDWEKQTKLPATMVSPKGMVPLNHNHANGGFKIKLKVPSSAKSASGLENVLPPRASSPPPSQSMLPFPKPALSRPIPRPLKHAKSTSFAKSTSSDPCLTPLPPSPKRPKITKSGKPSLAALNFSASSSDKDDEDDVIDLSSDSGDEHDVSQILVPHEMPSPTKRKRMADSPRDVSRPAPPILSISTSMGVGASRKTMFGSRRNDEIDLGDVFALEETAPAPVSVVTPPSALTERPRAIKAVPLKRHSSVSSTFSSASSSLSPPPSLPMPPMASSQSQSTAFVEIPPPRKLQKAASFAGTEFGSMRLDTPPRPTLASPAPIAKPKLVPTPFFSAPQTKAPVAVGKKRTSARVASQKVLAVSVQGAGGGVTKKKMPKWKGVVFNGR